MATNKGLLREDEFIYYINNKSYDTFTDNIIDMMERLYGVIEQGELFLCEKTKNYIKPDFVISYKGEKKAISLKSGNSRIVHAENIKPFILFLRELGVSTETQKTILLYQYGDGTFDGSGSKRWDSIAVNKMLSERIKKANEELNSNKELIKKFLERVLFQGVDKDVIKADAIYYGDIKEGVVVLSKQIDKYVDYKKSWSKLNQPHIGPIFIRPNTRCLDFNAKTEPRRHRVECHWYCIKEDVYFIANRFTYYSSPFLSREKKDVNE